MSENTIKLAVYGIPPVELEQTCSANVSPGMLLGRDVGGTVSPHGAAGGFASPKLVAVENIFEGKTISDVYTSGEKVWFIGARPGDVMWMYLSSGAAVIGSLLVSDGAGALELAGITPHTDGSIVGTALEAKTGGAGVRIKVEIA